MRKPGFGEMNMGAVVGAVAGSICGLFSVGIAPAIRYRDATQLFAAPNLALICWAACLVAGWLIGGQVGPRLGMRFKSQRAEIAGGLIGGLALVTLIVFWSWYKFAR